MNQAEWQRIEEVLAEVLELSDQERRAKIELLCDGQPEIRAQVESLLTAHRNAGSFLDARTQIHSDSLQEFSLVDTSLGPYRLLEAIGRGGMGTIYRAERTDGRFQKQVAIKVVPAAPHSAELLRRFAGEQQILATLEHPNIARLLDAGVSSDGVPYLVMEYVEGTPVTDYCRSQQLSTRDRLRLFQTICSAVHYAHQHLVVHRDIKPANILVTADGTPKLLDFGIAKLLDPWSGSPAGMTLSVLSPMTPAYASPEQARGEVVTTATDIYSLGMVLYELLTGQPPYVVTGKSLTEAIHIISETEPEKPGVLLRRHGKRGEQPTTLEIDTSPDIDAIVAKAMRKDPRQRYTSAQELGADVAAFLAGLPVSAHRGSFQYVARKFVGRHKIAVISALVAALMAAAGVSAVVWQARVAQRERMRAQRRFDQVRSLANSLMFEIHDNIVTLPGSTEARRVIVIRALQYLDSLASESEDDASLQMELAAAYVRVGNLQGGGTGPANLGDFPGALASYEKARDILSSVLARNPGRQDALEELGKLYANISNLQLRLRNPAKGREAAEKGLALWKSLAQRSPDDEQIQHGLAFAHYRLADAMLGGEASLVPRNTALAIFRSLLERHPERPDAMHDVALCEKVLGSNLLSLGRTPDGIPHLEQARELDKRRVAAAPNDAVAKLDLSFDLSELSQAYENENQPKRALGYMQQVMAIRQALVDADPKNIRVRGRLAFAFRRMGELQSRLKEYAPALPNFRSSISIDQTLGNDPEVLSEIARTYTSMGDAESQLAGRQGGRNGRASHLEAACTSYERAAKQYAELKQHNLANSDDLQDNADAEKKVASCNKTLHR